MVCLGGERQWEGVIQLDMLQGAPLESPNSPRLAKQLASVASVVRDGEERTLRVIAALAGCEPQSASARLRELRNRHGWTVKRRTIEGLVFYRAVPPNG